MDDDQIITIQGQAPLVLRRDEVAALLQVSENTVANLHRLRQLEGVKIGKYLRWRPDDVRAFVERLGKD